MNSLKSSFIFLETIVSLLIVSVIVTIFFKISYNKNSDKKFTKILEVSNNLKKSNYENVSLSTKILKIKKDNLEENLTVKEFLYKDENIKLLKYEIN